MGWLRRLLEREEAVNPETHERTRCGTCDGTGLDLKRTAMGAPGAPGEHPPLYKCRACGGKGYTIIARM
jgi:hypothetical protein